MPDPWHHLTNVDHCLSDVVCVSFGSYCNAVMKVIFRAYVSHMPGLFLLDIGGASYIFHHVMA